METVRPLPQPDFDTLSHHYSGVSEQTSLFKNLPVATDGSFLRQLRDDMTAEFRQQRDDMTAGFRQLRDDMTAELRQLLGRVDTLLQQITGDPPRGREDDKREQLVAEVGILHREPHRNLSRRGSRPG
ncbi:hypothetical protein E4U43_004541 [Claviceps pusilla]|uniref:Uncharacterized protein n=1 Tax=Claviceps pusilla TaxID=123648 RepID=A0A9P7NFY4_9HYPO|nr:hypothetical protein E4U43_004541 [Claviceps pusilla]